MGWRRTLLPVAITVAVVVVGYLTLTRGVDAWQSRADRPTQGEPRLPSRVDVPAPSVPTTGSQGPVGPVGLVFPVVSVESGLGDQIPDPWVAVSSLDGAYRAIERTDLPPASRGAAIQVSPDGRRLAWADGSTVVVYDTVRDAARSLPTEGPTTLGAFSPDGARILEYDGAMAALDVDSGRRTELGAVPSSSAVAGAAWAPESDQVAWVANRRLVTASGDGSGSAGQPTRLPQSSTLAWSPDGDRLVVLTSDGGTLSMWDRTGQRFTAAGRVDAGELYVERLLGFADDDRLAVVGLTSATGALSRAFTLSLDGGRTAQLTVLPDQGENWVSSAAVGFAADAVRGGSADYPGAPQQWSDRSVLSALVLGAFCVLGFYFTRLRRRRGRA